MELGRIVEETRTLVASELPDLELQLRFPPGTGPEAWTIETDATGDPRH